MQLRSLVSRASRLTDDVNLSPPRRSLRSSSRGKRKKNILNVEENLAATNSPDIAADRAVDQPNDDHVLLLARNLVSLVANQQAPVLTSLTAAQILEAIIEDRTLIDKIRESIDRKHKCTKRVLRPRTEKQAASVPAVSKSSDEATSFHRTSRDCRKYVKFLLSDRLFEEEPNDPDFVDYNLAPSEVSSSPSEVEFSEEFWHNCEQNLESLADSIEMDEPTSTSPSNPNRRSLNENNDDSDAQALVSSVSPQQNRVLECSNDVFVTPTEPSLLPFVEPREGERFGPFSEFFEDEEPRSSKAGLTTANFANMQPDAETLSSQVFNSQAGEPETIDVTAGLEGIQVPYDQSYSTNSSVSLISQNQLFVVSNTAQAPTNLLVLQNLNYIDLSQKNYNVDLQEAPPPQDAPPQAVITQANDCSFDPPTLCEMTVKPKVLKFKEIAKFLHLAPIDPQNSREFAWLRVLPVPNSDGGETVSSSAARCEMPKEAKFRVSITEIGEKMFAEQMRQHVQMLLQSYLLCFHVTKSSYVIGDAMVMLLGLRKLKHSGGICFRFDPWKNLENAFNDMSAKFSFSGKCIEGFPTELIEHISRSRSFLYVELLPNMLNCATSSRVSNFVPGENELAAMCFLLLRKFFATFNLCRMIKKFALPYRSNNEISQHLCNMGGAVARSSTVKEVHTCVNWEYVLTGNLKPCYHSTTVLDERSLFERWPGCSLTPWLEVDHALTKAYDATALIL
ncbi:hypothetical protein TTRE_0000150801 [Trichuris trichiura]|uniref:Uncharacterized protein n=1 Tax=Trichuris trichiura TaxID=36087 RepID=A0A077YZS0_TRITR|nr:hypothetical protein TTRE_0000150801 [Trichuris trichiura]